MKKYLTTLLICFAFINAYAQLTNFDLGQVRSEDFSSKYCPIDSTANAYVMNNKGEAYFSIVDGHVQIIYYYYTKIKVTSSAGVKWGEIEIPYYDTNNYTDRVVDIKAVSYNYDDMKLIKSDLSVTDIFDKKINSSWRMKKFAIPNVKTGSVIEYCYTVISDYVFDFRDWNFQWEIPVINSKFTTRMIPFYEYSFVLQGHQYSYKSGSKIDEYNDRNIGSVKFKDMIYDFEMKDIAAFKDEDFITSKDDYISKINFQLAKVTQLGGVVRNILTTWPELTKDLLEDDNYGKYIASSEKIGQKLFVDSIFKSLTNQQKFDSILNFVKSNIHWNGENRIYTTKKPQKLLTDNHGNSAEINLFTIALLNSHGIKAEPLLISTRDHGKLKVNYPFIDFFNYSLMLVDVDGTLFISDATDPVLANNRVPINCMNEIGLIVKKTKTGDWVGINTNGLSRTKTNIKIDVTHSKADFRVNCTEYDAVIMKKKVDSNVDYLKDYLKTRNYNIVDSTISIPGYNKINSIYAYNFSINRQPEIIGDKMYVSPFLNEVIMENPFKQDSRENPIDMIYSKYRSYNTVIELPKGYEVKYLPAKKIINDPLFQLNYSCERVANSMIVSLIYYFKKSIYDATDYLKLKGFYDEIISCANEKIVFEKL